MKISTSRIRLIHSSRSFMADRSSYLPGVIAFPPLVFLGAMGAGLLLHWLMPVQPFSPAFSQSMGTVLCAAGGVVGIWGGVTMHRAGTSVRPGHPATVLVTRGPFRFSRNPLYLSLAAVYVGTVLIIDALWPLITLAPALVFVHWRIVLREERYLENRFGDEYRAYKARVRRWI